MTEDQFKSIVRNNLGLYKGGIKTRDEAIESIVGCIWERPKLSCDFGNDYCRVHKYGVKPCETCRVAYENELTTD